MVTSTNDNATYHLVELDGTRIAILVAEEHIKAFKKRHEAEPDPGEEAGSMGKNEEDRINDGSGEDK